MAVTVKDNDSASIIVSTPSLEMAQGTRRTYTLVLGSKPAANVSVAFTTPPTGVTVSPVSPVVFTPSDWSNPRTMTVHAASATATTPATIGTTDLEHTDRLATPPQTISLDDQGARACRVSPSTRRHWKSRKGSSGSYTVVLTSEPSATVQVGRIRRG